MAAARLGSGAQRGPSTPELGVFEGEASLGSPMADAPLSRLHAQEKREAMSFLPALSAATESTLREFVTARFQETTRLLGR